MKIICIGDSNTLGYDPRSFLGEQYPKSCIWTSLLAAKLGAVVVNEGEIGRKVSDIAYVKIEECDCLILMLGTNDILEGRSADRIRQELEEGLRNLPIRAKTILLIAPPSLKLGAWISDFSQVTQSQKLAQEYSELAKHMRFFFVNAVSWDIPLCYDGVHFTEAGHLRFASYLSEKLNVILRQL